MPRAPFIALLSLIAAPAFADPAVQPVRRDTLPAHHAAIFDKADTNHDGYLSKQEYVAALTAISRRRGVTPTPQGWAKANAQWDTVDRNHAGRMSRDQFIAAAMAHFDGADINHDGTLTPEEARKAAKIKQKALARQEPGTGA